MQHKKYKIKNKINIKKNIKKMLSIISVALVGSICLMIFSSCAGAQPDFSDPNLNVDSLDKIWQFKYYNDYGFVDKSRDALTEYITSNGTKIDKITDVGAKLSKFSKLVEKDYSSKKQGKEIAEYLTSFSQYLTNLSMISGGDTQSVLSTIEQTKNLFSKINQQEKDSVFIDKVFSDGITLAAVNTAKLSSETKKDDEIIITFGGNTMLGNMANDWQSGFNQIYYSKEKSANYPFVNVMPYFLNDDYTVITYEGNLTTKSAQVADGFNGFAEYANILKNSSIELASVATEHARDFYEAGFDETKDVLTKAGIGTFSDSHSYSLETKIGKIAFLSYELSESEPDVRLAMINDFKKANEEKHPIIIVNFHWGYKESADVSAKIQKLASQAVGYGADIVIGSHPYVTQGISMIKNHPVVYSMGNLSLCADKDTQFKDNFLFRVKIKKSESSYDFTNFEIIPVVTSLNEDEKYVPSPVIGAKADEILNRVKSLSANLDYGIKELN